MVSGIAVSQHTTKLPIDVDATVTLTVTPAEGYQLDKLTVVDKDGKGVVLTDKGNGKYTFKMPASKVETSPPPSRKSPPPTSAPLRNSSTWTPPSGTTRAWTM